MLPPALLAQLSTGASSIACKLSVLGLTLLAAFLGGMWIEHWRGEAKYQTLVAKVEQDRADAQARERAKERERFKQREIIERNDDARTQSYRRALAAARVDGDRLRELLAVYASGTGSDPAAACKPDGRAAVLADLLGEADRLAEESAGAADRYAGQVRGLQDYINRVVEPAL